MFRDGFVQFLLHDASIFVYLIILTSVTGTGLILRRAHALWVKYSLDHSAVTTQIAGMVETGRFSDAIQVCNSRRDPMTSILKEALTRANHPEELAALLGGQGS